MQTQIRFIILVTCLLLTFDVSDQARNKKMTRMPNGSWGGQHIRIEIANDSAEIDYDCAHGTIDGPLRVDSRGHFSLAGKHFRERPGPIREGEESNGQPAKYTGSIAGDKMTLTVTLKNAGEALGTYTLVHGSPGRVWKCK